MKIQITYRREDIVSLIAKDIQSRSDIVETGGISIQTEMTMLLDNKYQKVSPKDICECYIATVDSIGV